MVDDFVRSQEDPVTFFRLRALALAPRLGLTTAFVDEHINIFIAALGADWLAAASVDVPPGIPIAFPRHPLGHIVSVAGPEQVAEALEIGEYLCMLQSAPNLGSVLTALKGQYYQTLLQIAFAARLQRAGVQDLRLEPPASEGRLSDLLFGYAGKAYRAECFRPFYKPRAEMQYELARLAQACIEAAQERSPLIFSVAVALTVAPTAEVRRDIVSVVRDAARQVNEDIAREPGSFPSVLAQGPIGTVSVTRAVGTRPGTPPILIRHPSFPHAGNDWDLFVRVGRATVASVSGVQGIIEGVDGMSHFGAWLPPGLNRVDQRRKDPEKSMERLGRKIEGKLAQTRSTVGEDRILIVDAWQTRYLLHDDPKYGERLRRKIVESHDAVAGLLMVNRQWTGELGRYGYDLVPLVRDGEPRLPEGLIQRLRERLPTGI